MSNIVQNQFSLTSKLKTTRGETTSSLVWTPSPDRLWSTSKEGTAFCHELKRGKKTIERLKEQGKGQSSGLVLGTPSREPSPRPVSPSDSDEPVVVTGVERHTDQDEDEAPKGTVEEASVVGEDATEDGSGKGGDSSTQTGEGDPVECGAQAGEEEQATIATQPVFESYPSASALDLPETPALQSFDPQSLLDSMDEDIAKVTAELEAA